MQSVFTRTLRPFIMLNVACDTCGMIRVAIPAGLASRSTDVHLATCPLCEQDSPFEQIGSGETVRPLPFFEPAGNYLPQAISGTYTNEANSKSLRPGTLVSYSEETGVYQFATIQEIVVQRDAMSDGYPGLILRVEDETSPMIRHRSSRELPFWCYPWELKQEKQKKGRK